jgi:outer membrane lipoprotein
VALDAADKLVGTPVRWGGTIAQVDNKQNETWIELVQKDLRNSGQPLASDHSEGRFVARVAGFLDPAIYSKGREMTVAGTLDQPLPGRIGEFGYLFPVVKANTVYLWEKEPDVVYYDPMPYWYYDPWYPYRFPYHYYPPYWRR